MSNINWRELGGNLSDDKKAYVFPQVVSINKHGRKTIWQVYVRLMDENKKFVVIKDKYFDNTPMLIDVVGVIKVDSYVEDGKLRDSAPTIVPSGTNIGKKNETNVFCQALRDARGMYNSQIRHAHDPNKVVNEANERLPPMLSNIGNAEQPYTFPLTVQRKYNGIRAVVTTEKTEDKTIVVMYSRTLKDYTIPDHLGPELKELFKSARNLLKDQKVYLDGEIYLHNVPLNLISGAMRNYDANKNIKLEYIVYDIFTLEKHKEMKYSDRKLLLDLLFKSAQCKYVKLVDSFTARNKEEIKDLYAQFIKEGFEGAMIRDNARVYEPSFNGYHSQGLLKLKPTFDNEYKIIGWKLAEKGKANGAFMIICETADGKPFNVTPALEIDVRIKLANDIKNGAIKFDKEYLNKMLIVYFDERGVSGIPQRARTKMEIRTWE